MSLKSPRYPFGLKPLLEFFSCFSNPITASGSEVYKEATLLGRCRGEVSQLREQTTMMPFLASCYDLKLDC